MNSGSGFQQLLYEQYIRMLHLHESYANEELDHFLRIASAASIENCPRNLTDIHVIDCIGRYEPINSTSIAERMELSKAGITKISGRLLADGLVERTQMNDNKKEVYFLLTRQGRILFDLHEKLHDIEAERAFSFLGKYPAEELHIIQRFIQDVNIEMESRLGKTDIPEMNE
ncbi:MarR family transcriptional regulator [Paenibacillus sp. NPDC057934]|uniref:MarR family transcriptional regulator n=1 Tax=Paenibacillus sp. NPDC057934 TaxID=3346282 RepID=UPI0036DE2533